MQSGALYAVHQTASNGPRRGQESGSVDASETVPTIRTSAGEFAFRSTEIGCFLELIMGKVHRILGLYGTNEAALDALINQRTGLGSWDTLAGSVAKSQVAADRRRSAFFCSPARNAPAGSTTPALQKRAQPDRYGVAPRS